MAKLTIVRLNGLFFLLAGLGIYGAYRYGKKQGTTTAIVSGDAVPVTVSPLPAGAAEATAGAHAQGVFGTRLW